MKRLKNIFEYLLFLLITRTMRLLTVDKAAGLCGFIGRKIGPKLKVSGIAENNLKKIYGDNIDIGRVIEKMWDNLGRYIGEFSFIDHISTEELNKRVTLTGLENIESLRVNNKPFLLFLCHQANWDFVIRKINSIYPKFVIAYRKINNPYIDRILLEKRQNPPYTIMIEKSTGGAKELLKAIKAGYSVAMLVDQKMNNGIEVPFFNYPAMTAPAIARLSMQYNYPIVPLQIVRRGGLTEFDIIVHKPLEYELTSDREVDTYNIMLKINQTLESFIEQHPEQWFWVHNRWKE